MQQRSKELTEARQPLRQLQLARSPLEVEEKEKEGRLARTIQRFRFSGICACLQSPRLLAPVFSPCHRGNRILGSVSIATKLSVAWFVCLFSFYPEEKKRVSGKLREAREEAKRNAASNREKVLHDKIQQVNERTRKRTSAETLDWEREDVKNQNHAWHVQ